MIMQILLTTVLVVLVAYARAQRRRAMLISDLVSLVSLAGLVFVWNPDLTNEIAALVGIGRGADLLLYCFVIATLIVTFSLHLRLRAGLQQTTELARHMAIQNARRPRPAPPVPGETHGP